MKFCCEGGLKKAQAYLGNLEQSPLTFFSEDDVKCWRWHITLADHCFSPAGRGDGEAVAGGEATGKDSGCSSSMPSCVLVEEHLRL